ncbi:cysteine methyltransferase [Reichenbachiella sp. 5M10]|uniref:methylated-DNA--[protein]-cysteine S-methyltransferase n=1 Tax=Reichenbachiella sp. 5M10 TaxID=1889772 RepID=UPI000C144D09|nr:methylated-DNA--[protein]-cysteine S-methyltransferase [Reichenbachiella sp. 5M10]PIB36096.1 cysteine methyltransferase [Reichenbachiella sp. 5M10]
MADTIDYQYYKSPVGELIIGSYGGEICLCDWRYRKQREAVDKRIWSALDAVMVEKDSTTVQACIQQLQEYFVGERREFDLSLRLVGSDFQKEVWGHLMQVPYGQTKSYLALAQSLNNEGAIRAVASANGANALSIVVPCHRIIGSDGSLTGYAGGLPAKKRLLELEGSLLHQISLF